MLEGRATFALKGVDLAAEGRGRGRTLVLAHGFSGRMQDWDPFFGALAQGRHVLRYDLRGFGASQPRGDVAFRHSEDLAALLDAVEVEQCDLLGVSMGGAVALNFTLDHPERVRRLVLLSPGITAWEWSDNWRALWGPIVETARAGDLDRARELWWAHPLFDTTRAAGAAADHLHATILAYSGRHWLGPDGEAAALPDVERLHGLSVPLLLLTGAEDLLDFRLIGDLIEAAAPNVRRKDYPGCGHMLHLERPATFLRDVAGFLNAP